MHVIESEIANAIHDVRYIIIQYFAQCNFQSSSGLYVPFSKKVKYSDMLHMVSMLLKALHYLELINNIKTITPPGPVL